jgi:plasmid stabilization system protein ParE
MTLRVEIEPTAELQLLDLDAWWRECRPAARSRVTDEYARLLAMLAERPEVGAPYRHKDVRNVRWLRMKGTPYLVYYHHESGSDLVTIVAVWSGMRGEGPPL